MEALKREMHQCLIEKPLSVLVDVLLRREEIMATVETERSEPPPAVSIHPIRGRPLWSLRRINQVFYHSNNIDESMRSPLCHRSTSSIPEKTTYSLQLRWKCFLTKCLDASPLVIAFAQNEEREKEKEQEKEKEKELDGKNRGDGVRLVTYIGSHFRQFQAVDMETGEILWQQTIGGRIESSATASRSGEGATNSFPIISIDPYLYPVEVIVGGYDHFLHVFSSRDGRPLWKFETGDEVKSSPATDEITGYVWFGSHDHHL